MYTFAKLGIGAAILCGAVVATAAPAAAQRYGGGYANGQGPYGGSDYNQSTDYYNRAGEHIYCGRNMAHIVNWIVDPASGMRITRENYQARYPWTDLNQWTYDCGTNLWTDHTAEANPGYYTQDYPRNRGRGYSRR